MWCRPAPRHAEIRSRTATGRSHRRPRRALDAGHEQQGVDPTLVGKVEDQSDQGDDGREDDSQGLVRPDLVLERACPFDIHPGRERFHHLVVEDAFGFFDESDQVAIPDPELDIRTKQAVLALDHRRPLDNPDVGHLCQRDLETRGRDRRGGGCNRRGHAPLAGRRPAAGCYPGCGNEDVLERLDVIADIASITARGPQLAASNT